MNIYWIAFRSTFAITGFFCCSEDDWGKLNQFEMEFSFIGDFFVILFESEINAREFKKILRLEAKFDFSLQATIFEIERKALSSSRSVAREHKSSIANIHLPSYYICIW